MCLCVCVYLNCAGVGKEIEVTLKYRNDPIFCVPTTLQFPKKFGESIFPAVKPACVKRYMNKASVVFREYLYFFSFRDLPFPILVPQIHYVYTIYVLNWISFGFFFSHMPNSQSNWACWCCGLDWNRNLWRLKIQGQRFLVFNTLTHTVSCIQKRSRRIWINKL